MFLDKKDKRGLGLSDTAYCFLGGIVQNAEALCALFNPTVNSYKRINGSMTRSGATWAPNTVTYSGNNRTHMIRVPDDGRFELRLMDGAANPYLMQAGFLAAGLDGIENETNPGEPQWNDMYAEPHKAKGAKRLPLNLLDAVRSLDKSKRLRAGLGDELVDAFVKLKMQDWQAYSAYLSDWERSTTLDC